MEYMPNTNHHASNNLFENPECKPLENVFLWIPGDGISREVPALDKHWVDDRYLLRYEAPELVTEEGEKIIGARERWIELTTFINEDLKWLLGLPYFKFWSNISYKKEIMDMLISVLQEAPPFYNLESFPNDKEMKELLSKLFRNVLVIFARLVTNKESPTEYMTQKYQGVLLYDEYIFTIPTILDFCQQFGRENKKTVGKILSCLFQLQPLYTRDLQKSVTFLIQVFRNIEQRFEDCPVPLAGEVVQLSERGGASFGISLTALEDIIIYLLDTLSTLVVFLENYPPAVSLFHTEMLMNKLVSVYENTIPEMYKRLQSIANKEETLPKLIELKQFLDGTRIQLLKLYRMIIYKDIEDVLDAPTPLSNEEIKDRVETFVELLTNAIEEKEFVMDYHRMYPVDVDIDILLHIYPETDQIKCKYIMSSVYASLDTTDVKSSALTNDLAVAGPSNIQNHKSELTKEAPSIPEEKLVALMAEVKDVLCDLGEGFIAKCLEYYKYKSESVINAVLEDSLPAQLKSLDFSTPYIPEEKMTQEPRRTPFNDFEQLEDSDSDVDEICRRVAEEVIDTAKDRRQEEYRNLHDALNDKSHIKEVSDIYHKYSYIADEYEDEYDDTYDSQDVGPSTQDDAVEFDRPFTVPRVLRNRVERNENIVEEEEFEEEPENPDNFVQDPAELRARAEQRRLIRRGGGKGLPPRDRDVTGNPKGQGQDKAVTKNREFKSTHKSSQANHNRRTGSSWKRRQGMVPS